MRVAVEGEAKPGDKIRLVVAEDVRASDLVVIARGAIGEATVTGVDLPDRKRVETGLRLRLDWIKDVTDGQVALRASEKGKSKSFTVEVLSAQGGIVARPVSLRRALVASAIFRDLVDEFHRKDWIPTGARIRGFVRGEVTYELEEVRQAQALLPISNGNAVLTIYRTKGNDDSRPECSATTRKLGKSDHDSMRLLTSCPANTCAD